MEELRQQRIVAPTGETQGEFTFVSNRIKNQSILEFSGDSAYFVF